MGSLGTTVIETSYVRNATVYTVLSLRKTCQYTRSFNFLLRSVYSLPYIIDVVQAWSKLLAMMDDAFRLSYPKLF